MRIFLDTSSLFKLYHEEVDSYEVIKFLEDNKVTKIFISEISILEFDSIVWKKVRKHEFDKTIALELIKLFEKDLNNNDDDKFSVILLNKELINLAKKLFEKYGNYGLRSLDAIQFASALSVKSEASKSLSPDKLLQTFFNEELQ